MPTTSRSVIGRPSISASRIASTTSPRGPRRAGALGERADPPEHGAAGLAALRGRRHRCDGGEAVDLGQLVGGRVEELLEEDQAGQRPGEVVHEVAGAGLDELVDEPVDQPPGGVLVLERPRAG